MEAAERLAQKLGSETLRGWHSREEVEREGVTGIKGFSFDTILMVPGTINLIVNIKFIWIKATLDKNLKRPKHNYSACHLVVDT
jgi:hypothetical protein